MRTDDQHTQDERSKDGHGLVWPISISDHGEYTTIGLPDRLSDGRPFTAETYHQFPTLEELGIEDWSSDVFDAVIPDDRAVAVCSSTSAWKPNRLRRAHRELWSLGVRWRFFSFGGCLSLFLPAGLQTRRALLSKCLGFEDEWYPQVALVYSARWSGEWNPRELFYWCRNKKLWQEPSRLLDLAADRVVAIFDGWIFLLLRSVLAKQIVQNLQATSSRWHQPFIKDSLNRDWLPER